jgi:hypothetical protein
VTHGDWQINKTSSPRMANVPQNYKDGGAEVSVRSRGWPIQDTVGLAVEVTASPSGAVARPSAQEFARALGNRSGEPSRVPLRSDLAAVVGLVGSHQKQQ